MEAFMSVSETSSQGGKTKAWHTGGKGVNKQTVHLGQCRCDYVQAGLRSRTAIVPCQFVTFRQLQIKWSNDQMIEWSNDQDRMFTWFIRNEWRSNDDESWARSGVESLGSDWIRILMRREPRWQSLQKTAEDWFTDKRLGYTRTKAIGCAVSKSTDIQTVVSTWTRNSAKDAWSHLHHGWWPHSW